MKTLHTIFFHDANQMTQLQSESVDLIVTSPPYPVIALWDEVFINRNEKISDAFTAQDGERIFELMHQELDIIWNEVYRVLKPGAICCINIGDAVRTIGKEFQLFPNHSRILTKFMSLDFTPLPEIIWRKPTNAPNKFMGSGMLPPNAYITLEHEFILVFRKGGKRPFVGETQKDIRRESSYFWEERNIWFSDIWDLPGVSQKIDSSNSRNRSAAFPFELAYRLVNMFSVKEDTVLDPFLGTGTTTLACMATARNSLGYEIDSSFESQIKTRTESIVEFSNSLITERLNNHKKFVKSRIDKGKELKYTNNHYSFPVITKQEQSLYLNPLKKIKHLRDSNYEIEYLTKE
jgi:DNA modification methylase